MKRFTLAVLVALLACGAAPASAAVGTATPTATSWAGFIASTGVRFDGEVATGGLFISGVDIPEGRGFARFSLAGIPAGAVISEVRLQTSISNHDLTPPHDTPACTLTAHVRHALVDTTVATPAAIFAAVLAGPLYTSFDIPRTGDDFCASAFAMWDFDLGPLAVADVTAALPTGVITLGLLSDVNCDPLGDHLDWIGFDESVAGACGVEPLPGSRITLLITYVACGDGSLDPATEECDDGNTMPGDGCRADCTIEVCGDGILDAPAEACDDGNTMPGDGCRADCTIEACGDGILDVPAEACDDGNTTPGDGCRADCTIEICGDGTLDAPAEACDDGNTMPGDGCRADCTIERCGDGTLDMPAEDCDDGNTMPGDGCRADCTIEVCGDGTLDVPTEACDDGNTMPGDGCRADCTIERCGDGTLDMPAEDCDDGNTIPGDGCRADCTIEVCGDGTLDPGELCDDGNDFPMDGCEPDCTFTPPMAVHYAVFAAHQTPAGVVVSWRTSSEIDTAGFQIWAEHGDGTITRLSGTTPARGAGWSYERLDDANEAKEHRRVAYRIVEIETSGRPGDPTPWFRTIGRTSTEGGRRRR